jgi:hypothetical protein
MLDKYKYMDIIYATLSDSGGMTESRKRSSQVRVHLFCWESYLTLKKIIAGENNGTEGRRGGWSVEEIKKLNPETWPVDN